MKKRRKRRKPDRAAKLAAELRPMIREAAKTGLAEAIEHCSNFWNVSDGYKRYIDHQITSQADALMDAVQTVFRKELATWELASSWRPPKRRKRN